MGMSFLATAGGSAVVEGQLGGEAVVVAVVVTPDADGVAQAHDDRISARGPVELEDASMKGHRRTADRIST